VTAPERPSAPPLKAAAIARQLLVASRPVSWINTAYPFAAAYLLTTREIDATLIIGTIFFLIPYNLAMYGINDVFDYESDLRNPRKGGAHGAVLDERMHRITLWAAADGQPELKVEFGGKSVMIPVKV